MHNMYVNIIISDASNGGGVTVRVAEVNEAETVVTGLTPGVLYIFSVTTENDVSYQDNATSARTVTTTATTEGGGETSARNNIVTKIR